MRSLWLVLGCTTIASCTSSSMVPRGKVADSAITAALPGRWSQSEGSGGCDSGDYTFEKTGIYSSAGSSCGGAEWLGGHEYGWFATYGHICFVSAYSLSEGKAQTLRAQRTVFGRAVAKGFDAEYCPWRV